MKALFVCDNKDEWNLLRNIFHAHFTKMELICATKSEDALNYMSYEGPFALVLIECGMKDNDPTELAENIFEQSGERPIIFIGTENMIKDRVDGEFYMENDMVHVYNKPYDGNALKEIIQQAIEWAKKEEFESSIIELDRDQFLSVKLRNFYLFEDCPYDVFIELTKTKFVKAISKNKGYTESTIQDFQRRNIKFLYLQKDEHLNFLERSIEKVIQTLKTKNTNPKVLIQTQIAAALIIHQYLRDVGISESVISLTEEVINTIPKIFDSLDDDLMAVLSAFPMEQGDLAEQAILKAFFCESICRGLGWSSDFARRKLVLAALIHDFYLRDEELTKITHLEQGEFQFLLQSQKEEFLEHAAKAAEMARHFTRFSDVDFIIEQHHELPDGSGFPRKLNSNKITSIAGVFILSSNFVTQLVIHGMSRISVMNTLAGFNRLFDQGNFKDSFKSLKKAIKG